MISDKIIIILFDTFRHSFILQAQIATLKAEVEAVRIDNAAMKVTLRNVGHAFLDTPNTAFGGSASFMVSTLTGSHGQPSRKLRQ